MAKNKGTNEVRNLIYFLTYNKELTREQLAKRDRLLARDCVEPTAYQNIYVEDKKSNKGNYNDKVEYVSPNELRTFLYKFNQDEILKYTCHEIDTEETIEEINKKCNTEKYDFELHSKLIIRRVNTLFEEQELKNGNFRGLLKAYLGISHKPWSTQDVPIWWNHEELIKWSKENEGIILSPGRNIAKKQKKNGYRLQKPIKSYLTGERIDTFSKLVIYFKSLFHIRRDNSLRSILSYQNKKHVIEGINISFSTENFNDNIELLTDVDKLVQAYKKILGICKEANKDNEINIELSFYESGDKIFFVIYDKGHFYRKPLKAATERIGESQTSLIKNQINGLCNLYIEADFDEKTPARIDLWTEKSSTLGSNAKIPFCRVDKVNGVKYILEFN